MPNQFEASPKQTFLAPLTQTIYQGYDLLKWYLHGKQGAAPHIVKRSTVKFFQRQFKAEIFIETGTYMGDMVDAVKDFKKIYSIELSENLYNQATARFSKYPHIKIMHGDSGKVLPTIIDAISEPCLFWLDGHYSGGITAR